MNRKRRSVVWTKLTDDEFRELVKNSKTQTEIRNFFGFKNHGNTLTIKLRIKELNIDTSHFKKCYDEMINYVINRKFSLESIMSENSTLSRHHLKRRLLKEGLLKNECSLCGQEGNWKGKELRMIIDHINGISNDNRLENLRMVCPNCNSQLDTFSGRNNKRILEEHIKEKIIKEKKIYICDCGKEKCKDSKMCIDCKRINERRVERPTKDILLQEIKEFGYSATGRKYNVSDNAIRKWLKKY